MSEPSRQRSTTRDYYSVDERRYHCTQCGRSGLPASPHVRYIPVAHASLPGEVAQQSTPPVFACINHGAHGAVAQAVIFEDDGRWSL